MLTTNSLLKENHPEYTMLAHPFGSFTSLLSVNLKCICCSEYIRKQSKLACRCPSLQWVCYSHQCTIKQYAHSASYIWLDRVLVDSIVWILELGLLTYAVAIQYMIYKNDPLINIAMQWVITMYYRMWCDHSASLDSLFYIWLDRISRYYYIDTSWY